MPASKFTKKATTPKLQRQWQHTYDSVKSKGGTPGSAVRQANSVVKKSAPQKKRGY